MTLAGDFAAVHGTAPAGIWSAPGRVNLIGEHTDYNQGYVLPFAISRRTRVAVAPRADQLIRVSSAAADGLGEADLRTLSPDGAGGWSAYPLGTAWALRELAGPAAAGGFDARFDSDVPLGAGLSSSAAIECSLALALRDLWRLDAAPADLVAPAQRAENEFVGAPTGILDQSASLLGQAGRALFIDCRDAATEPVPFDPAAAGLALHVIDTRVRHAHATGGYAARRASCEDAARTLSLASLRDLGQGDLPGAARLLDEETFRRVRHVVTENQRVLDTVAALRAAGPAAIGPLLLASHESLRRDFEVTVPELDLAVEAAMTAGAAGARMTGGGFGGSAIALIPAGGEERLARVVRRAFTRPGMREPAVFAVEPSPGARRDS